MALSPRRGEFGRMDRNMAWQQQLDHLWADTFQFSGAFFTISVGEFS